MIDASVAVKWFAPERGHEAALTLLGTQDRLVAPDLVVAETMHAMRKKLRSGDVTPSLYVRAGSDLASYFGELVPSAALVDEATRLSIRLDHGFYDCVYLALAVTSGTNLVTADKIFQTKVVASGLDVAVLLEDWTDEGADQVPIQEDLIADVGRLADRVAATFRSLEQPFRTNEPVTFVPADVYDPAFDSPAYRRLAQLLLDLSREELAQVIALAWYGRDYEHGELTSLIRNARRFFAEQPERDMPYIVSVMGTVRAGFRKFHRSATAETKVE